MVEKVIITGASGLLGRYLLHTVDREIYDVYPFRKFSDDKTIPSLDVRHAISVKEAFEDIQPDYVIHCAAIGSPDYCEANFHSAWEVNVLGTWNVAKAANEVGAKMIYISSNAVYSGDNAPYHEACKRKPVNVYGLLKNQAEDIVRYYGNNYIIARPILMYGWPAEDGRDNLASYIINKSKEWMEFVQDIYVQPLYAEDCAEVIWKLLRLSYVELNIASDECMSIYEFAYKVAEEFEVPNIVIVPIYDKDLERNVAKRPVNTSYDLTGLYTVFGSTRTVEEGLRRMKENAF